MIRCHPVDSLAVDGLITVILNCTSSYQFFHVHILFLYTLISILLSLYTIMLPLLFSFFICFRPAVLDIGQKRFDRFT